LHGMLEVAQTTAYVSDLVMSGSCNLPYILQVVAEMLAAQHGQRTFCNVTSMSLPSEMFQKQSSVLTKSCSSPSSTGG